MRETILSLLFCVIAWGVVVYLGYSFILWDWNPAEWGEMNRATALLVAGSGWAGLGFLAYRSSDEE